MESVLTIRVARMQSWGAALNRTFYDKISIRKWYSWNRCERS